MASDMQAIADHIFKQAFVPAWVKVLWDMIAAVDKEPGELKALKTFHAVLVKCPTLQEPWCRFSRSSAQPCIDILVSLPAAVQLYSQAAGDAHGDAARCVALQRHWSNVQLSGDVEELLGNDGVATYRAFLNDALPEDMMIPIRLR